MQRDRQPGLTFRPSTLESARIQHYCHTLSHNRDRRYDRPVAPEHPDDTSREIIAGAANELRRGAPDMYCRAVH
jgi:hypothetical protein